MCAVERVVVSECKKAYIRPFDDDNDDDDTGVSVVCCEMGPS